MAIDIYSTYNNPTGTASSGRSYGGVPAAPQVNQLNSASGSFTGSMPKTYYQSYGAGSPGANYVLVQPSKRDSFGNWGQSVWQYQEPAAAKPATNAATTNTSGGVTGGSTAPVGGSSSPPISSTVPTAQPTGSIPNGPNPALQQPPTGASATQVQNPWNIAAQGSAINAGTAAAGQGAANIGQAANMRTAANTGVGAGNQVLNTAFDPQNALYDRTAQQLQDQVRVGEAARGITSSPYGADLENQAMSNFNIDWQNNQLGRQTQGLGAYNTALNSAGQANTTAGNTGQMGVGQTAAEGQIPWDTYNGQQQNNIQNWIAYMNQANAATGLAQINYPEQLNQAYLQAQGGMGSTYIPQAPRSY